jgi:hypothetical protein
MALLNPHRLAMACVFSALFGIAIAVTTVIPSQSVPSHFQLSRSLTPCIVVALALSVPSFLLSTAGTISISTRALGGIVGITIFTAIFDNKYAAHLKTDVTAAVLGQGYNSTVLAEVFGAVPSPNPAALQMSGLPASLVGAVEGALATARDDSWTFVWVAIACVVLACVVASCFLKSVAPRMNQHIESALEQSDVRQAQLEGQVDA